MYAVIKAGGKQHRVKSGDVIEVELTHGQEGETLEFKPLLVVDDDGKAHHGKDVAKAVVLAKLAGEQRGDKVKVFKYRPKTGYARRHGHRQLMTLLEIEDVSLEGKRPAAKKTTTTKAEPKTAAAEGSSGEEKPAPKRTSRTTSRSRTTQG
jgi:large subunit ribosomal protein L21